MQKKELYGDTVTKEDFANEAIELCKEIIKLVEASKKAGFEESDSRFDEMDDKTTSLVYCINQIA